MEGLLPSMTHQVQPPKIFQHRHRASAKNFHALLGVGSVAVRQITDRALRPIRKSQRYDHVVVGILFEAGHATRLHLDRQSTRQKSEEVHKMADFPENSSTALLGIVYPMIARDESRIHPVMQRQRFMNLFEK